MFSRFFIDRPIFATVLSVVITLAGGISLVNLPLAMYPQIAPPTVQVDCKYPGASAQVVAETVAAPIEQSVNGVEGMLYMSSQCTNDGSYNLTVTFQHGMDLNMAQVHVQNRVSLALPNLPDVIKQAGVTARKRSPDILLAIAINSDKDPVTGLQRYDQLYLSNYAAMKLKDELTRIDGVSDINMLGQQDYSMRIWVDPERLTSLGMTAGDVVRAIREQNRPVAAGQIGQPPIPEGQPIQMTLDVRGRMTDAEEFGRIVVRTSPQGRTVRLKDVARIELGPKSQDVATRVNGRPSISMAIFLLPDANALSTADAVKARMAELAKEFPPGMRYEIRYDTTPYISESIREVFRTLGESIVLVAVVVLLFLQNWRSAVIPLLAVPVGIVGTFAVMLALGFSINNLTLFGLVLAIGIVVDDAIVVVEAVEHHMEHGLPPREATIKAMDEVSGPVIAIGLVLSSVFIPCAFISGIVGQFFRQFALTIAASTLISTLNSLTLSPALSALLLKPPTPSARGRRPDPLPRLGIGILAGLFAYQEFGGHTRDLLGVIWSASASWPTWAGPAAGASVGFVIGLVLSRPVNWLLSHFFALFDACFKRATGLYVKTVGLLIRGALLVSIIYVGLLFVTRKDFETTAKGFIPSQDMGYLMTNVQLPDAMSLERSSEVMSRLEDVARSVKGVKFTQSMTGQSLLLSAFGSNFGSMFVILEPFEQRPNPFRDRFWRWMNRRRLPDWEDLTLVRYINGKRATPPPDKTLATYAEEWIRRITRNPEYKRPAPTLLYGEDVAAELRKAVERNIPDAIVTVLGPPPIRGVGRAGGFKLMVEDRGGLGLPRLQEESDKLSALAELSYYDDRRELVTFDPNGKFGPPKPFPPRFTGFTKLAVGMTSVFRANVPQLFANVDRAEAMTKQVPLRQLFESLQVYLGSLYVNDLNLFGRTWQVIVQAEPKFRNGIDDVRRLTVRNLSGRMVPVGSVATIEERNGPLILTRYNMHTAAAVNGSAAPGVSSGEAIQAMQSLAETKLSPSTAVEWTELAYLELQAGNTAMIVFGLAVVMVFLVLAAQYESWALPLAVILVVPMCLLCSIEGVNATDEDINIFTQIGFVVLVGLACKNAILIVEFARSQRMLGKPRREAALEACRLRLRPIVMTSLAFILGVFPLLLGQGAGAEMRRTLGVTVFSGMLGVTLFGLLLTPVFFVQIDWLAETKLFRSRAVRIIGTIPLAIITLGVVPFGLRAARRKVDQRLERAALKRIPSLKTVANGTHVGSNGVNGSHAAGGSNGSVHHPIETPRDSQQTVNTEL